MHGHDHRSMGMDWIPADWHYVGAAGEPAFQNGWSNSGGSKAPLRFRYMPGVDSNSLQPAVKIEGSITGGTSTIFTLPITLDYDTYHIVADDSGAPVTITVQQSGDVVDGFV
jgi:hypothetical protein